MIRAAFFLLISYALAAPLTTHISMDLHQTDWASLWTYLFWALSLFIWGGTVLALITMSGLVMAFLVWLLERRN